jgi:CelD/BcsL family acetyltransferase involved in cellulose biosynthesis
VGRKRRRLERDAEVEVTVTREGESVPGAMEAMFSLHEGRWEGRTAPSSFLAPEVRSFHMDLARAGAERGWLRLLSVVVDGQPAAVVYGWSLGGRWSYLQGGFDERYAKSSIGMVAQVAAIEAAIAEGADVYDMLLGDEAFKFRLATDARQVTELSLARPLSPLWIGARARPLARSAWRRLSPELRARLLRLGRRRSAQEDGAP